MKKILAITIGFLIFNLANAQIIVVDPPFPTAEVAATLTLNTAGTGLEGYTGEVYVHTGVTVNGNQWQNVIGDWGNNDNQPQLTQIGTDLYELEIEPSIREFYGVGASGVISEMSFVFRSADGNQQTSPDIFYDVYESGIAIKIVLPEERPLIVEENDVIHVEGNSSEADSTFLFVDNQQVYADTGSTFIYDITAENTGKTWVKAIAWNTTESVADSFYYFVRPPLTVEDPPEGTIDGINYIDDQTVILSLYAPEKEYVFAIGDFSDWEIEDEYFMKRSTDGKRYWIQLDNLEAGKEYIYQYFIDGTIRVGDMYADKVSDPWNDKWISNATYPNLIDYPEGKTTGIATVFQTAQTDYSWEVENFKGPEITDMVVYELLVRDFIGAHTFGVLIDSLDYLKRLGVNVIELMPFNEFEGNSSWGYNPNYYFAPDKYYGPKNTLKAFIDECHKQGIAVVMDIVLNHAFNTCPLAMMYWDAESNHPATNNPWFNVESPNPDYYWGSDFNHESPDTKNFIDRVNRYWMEEYKVDGFRFDFTKGFTNKPGNGWNYDQSRIDILTRMADVIWSYNPDAYVILEHLTVDNEEEVLSNEGILLWGNLNYNYNEATMGWNDNSDFSWISYQKRGWSQPHVMGYMESHDEERLMFKNISYGNGSGSYQTKDTATSLQRLELAGAFFFTIPGPKMIWQFGERGYDYSIEYNGRVGEKPPRWDYMENWRRQNLWYTWSSLISLKKEQDVFRTTDFDLSLTGAMKKIRLTSTEMSVVVLGNFGVVEGDIAPNFYSSGIWYDYFSGESLEVTDVNAPISLAAGEFRIYTDKKLDKPAYVGMDENETESNLQPLVYPNPVNNRLNVAVTAQLARIEIINLVGQNVLSLDWGLGKSASINVSGLQSGVYFIRIETLDGQVSSRKFLKK
jgi:glycosidase